MGEYGIKESALDTLIREAYAILGLQSFFTVGEDECRAWTIRKGMTAQEAAGVIHSDFVTKFIRAEVVHYDQFISDKGAHSPRQRRPAIGDWKEKNISSVTEISCRSDIAESQSIPSGPVLNA